MDTRPAMRDTRCWDDLRRGRGVPGRDVVGDRENEARCMGPGDGGTLCAGDIGRELAGERVVGDEDKGSTVNRAPVTIGAGDGHGDGLAGVIIGLGAASVLGTGEGEGVR
jgi:hypothetical protein